MVSFKSIIWFVAILLLILSFPIQVKQMSEMPAVYPYLLIVFTIMISGRKRSFTIRNYKSQPMELVIKLYLCLIGFHGSWQLMFGIITPYQAGTSVFIYGIPVIFYWYFNRRATEKEIQAVLIGITVAGIISGFFFAYDNIMKLGFGQITQFSIDAVRYSISRGQGGEDWRDLSSMRAMLGYRSFGLLQTHTISATATAFGCFALLAIVPKYRKKIRNIVVLIFLILLILGLNFTGLVAYVVVLFALEYRLITLKRILSKKNIKKIGGIIILSLCAVLILSITLNFDMLEYIKSSFKSQLMLATVGRESTNFLGIIISYSYRYFEWLIKFPPSLIIGDGYTSFGMLKGGDVGYIETFAKLGGPFFLIAVAALVKICWNHLQKPFVLAAVTSSMLRVENLKDFSISIILFLLVIELHYSAWYAKPVLPIFFMALGLYARFGRPQPIANVK